MMKKNSAWIDVVQESDATGPWARSMIASKTRRRARWVLAEITDDRTRLGSLVVLDAENLAAGPVATIQLQHRIPLKFHGDWIPA